MCVMSGPVSAQRRFACEHGAVAPAQETLSYRNAALEDFLLRQQTEMQQRRYAVWDPLDALAQHSRLVMAIH